MVGQGQFGRVYCASHRKTGRLVALKELAKDRFPTHQFLRELRFLLSLQHPNIVTCHALEHTATGRYLIMDYCEGGTLRSLMEEDVRLHPRQGLKLVLDILQGLDHAHSRGIIHCDIKPENILLTIQPQGWTARISDFGIARLNQEISKHGTGNTGSPAYMAPERFYGQHFQSSDLYAVGILLFELLAGYRPFAGPPAELMSAHLNIPVKFPDTIPAALKVVIQTALQKLPARRYHSAHDMRDAVQAAAAALQPTFEQDWQDSPLLRTVMPLSQYAFQFLKQEPLLEEVRQLEEQMIPAAESASLHSSQGIKKQQSTASGIEQARIYQVSNTRVGCQDYAGNLLTAAKAPITMVRLPESIRELQVRPHGCYAITQQSIYLLPEDLFQLGVSQHGQKCLPQGEEGRDLIRHMVPQLIVELGMGFTAAIAPNGRWMSTVQQALGHTSSVLHLWDLQRVHPIKAVPRRATHLFQQVALDHRHFAIFSHGVDYQTGMCITGVAIEVFTRRGKLVGTLNLPIPLQRLIPTPIPYRLIAMEPGHPTSMLIIDLKPLRVTRSATPIAPMLIAASQWGFVLVARDGQIALLDKYGQGIGRMAGPTHPTAIALMTHAPGLLLSTWNGEQGSLYTINLGQMELDIL